jgi:beta-phosphoglucomutase-like phosphatase (HAD superfamily)
MTAPGNDAPFDNSRPRPVHTVLDTLRARLDHNAFDGAVFSLESVVADLGYGDVRPLPGSIAWIDRLRSEGKRTAVLYSGEGAERALDIAGVRDRFDEVWMGSRSAETIEQVFEALGVPPDRGVVVDVDPKGVTAAREAGAHMALAIARSSATPAELRRAGAQAVVADLQELLGPING